MKEFRRPVRITGRFGAVRSFFSRAHTAVRAVDGISFSIEPGEMVAYLGRNGAGKSTTVKMLAGILVPTSGTIEVAGMVPWRERTRLAGHIGLVFGQRSQLWWDLPLVESLRLIGRLYGVPRGRYVANLERFVELLELRDFLDTPVRQLSLGQRMRGDLAAAMLYEPGILFLDEPTIGLDLLARERIRGFIREINREQQVTVILTTHDLTDVERLCDRLLLVDNGHLLHDGPISALRAAFPPYRELIVRMATGPADLPGVRVSRRGDGEWALRFDPAQVATTALVAALLSHDEVTDLSIKEPSLEDVVYRLYHQRDPSPAS